MFTSYLLQQPGGLGNSNPRGGGGGQPENQHQQLFVKDPLSLMQVSAGSDKEGQVRTSPILNRSQSMMTSPMQLIQSQLGLTPQQLQVLMHHHQQQHQLAFQSVSQF